jgi:hypothetical protein
MKKITISVFAFLAGASVGVWSMFGGGFMGNVEVSSNSDWVCKTKKAGTEISACTGGAWTTWDLETHTQIYEGFMQKVEITEKWYQLPHGNCGYRKERSEEVIWSKACTMKRTDPGAPEVEAATENIPAVLE